MSTLIKINPETMTMSSLDLAELVGVRHDNFQSKVLKVLGKEVVLKFKGYYIAANGKQNLCYHLTEREACLMAMSYSYELQARVYDEWQRLKSQAVALPSAKELAMMVLKAEEEKEAAQVEAKRLNQVCNTVTRQFVPGQTAARFCMQLNGVNCQQVQSWLASRGHLINEGRRGYRPSAETRDRYFKLYVADNGSGKEIYQAQLTQKGARWLYNKYLKGKLPMKKSWNGQFTHAVFELDGTEIIPGAVMPGSLLSASRPYSGTLGAVYVS